VAADAHGIFCSPALDVSLGFLGVDGGGHASDSQGNEYRGQRLVHFARTIFVEEFNSGAQIAENDYSQRLSSPSINDSAFIFMKFQGSQNYVATQDLMLAVNAAITTAAPAARQGRARHRQDHAGRGSGPGAGHAAAAVAHQVHHQGAAGPV
jgi:hypothetical protein